MAHRRAVGVGIVILILSVAGAFWRLARTANTEVAQSLAKLRRQRYDYLERQKISAELARQGESAYPALARALQDNDNSWELQYDRWRNKMPAALQGRLPLRPSKTELRRVVAQSLNEIGPTASRALVGVIEYGLEPSEGLANMDLLRALYWSIPESGKSVQILSNWLAHPAPGLPLFGMNDAQEIWPKVTQFAPLLPNWLKLADTAGEAAESLSCMGSNALFALPWIIEVADKGYVGGVENAQLHMSYTPSLASNVLNNNRACGLAALGRFGVTSPEILGALERGTTGHLPIFRAVAANALGDLGSNAAPSVPFLLAHLDPANSTVLRYQMEALGRMGHAALEAAPALRKYAEPAVATNVPTGGELGRIVRWGLEPPPLALCANIALCQVVPAAGQEQVETSSSAAPVTRSEFIAEAFGSLIPTNTIVQLRPIRSHLLPMLARRLEKSGGILLAYQTLLLEPENRAAAECLRAAMHHGESAARTVAAQWYAQMVGTTPEVLEVFRELLATVKDVPSQGPLNALTQIGPPAAPLAPQVQPLLYHEERIIRMLAGKALRSIAPAAMPPIGEN